MEGRARGLAVRPARSRTAGNRRNSVATLHHSTTQRDPEGAPTDLPKPAMPRPATMALGRRRSRLVAPGRRARTLPTDPTALPREVSPANLSKGVFTSHTPAWLHHELNRRVTKWNPLHTNDLRPTNYPNPRKKRNPCATTTYAQFGHPATLYFVENPKPAQKRKPLSSNTLRPHIRLLSRPKACMEKIPPPPPPPCQKVNRP